MDAWQDSVERRLGEVGKKLDATLLWILVAFASGFLALGALILSRTDAVNGRLDTLSQRVSELGERTARVEAHLPTAKP